MYRKILVPLDGSALAERSLEHVKAIAKGCSVPEVVLISVTMPILPAYYASEIPGVEHSVYTKAEASYEASLKGYLDKVAKNLQQDGIATKTAVVKGNAAEQILDYAAKNDVDLIIMTTHGRSGLARWTLGSVADRVVRLSTVPVLIVGSSGS